MSKRTEAKQLLAHDPQRNNEIMELLQQHYGRGRGKRTIEPLGKELEDYTRLIHDLQRDIAGRMFLIGRALKEAKEADFFEDDKDYTQWVENNLRMSKRQANRYIQVYERFGTTSSQVPIPSESALLELAQFPEEMSAEELLKKAQSMTVKEIRTWKVEVKGNVVPVKQVQSSSSTKEKADEILKQLQQEMSPVEFRIYLLEWMEKEFPEE